MDVNLGGRVSSELLLGTDPCFRSDPHCPYLNLQNTNVLGIRLWSNLGKKVTVVGEEKKTLQLELVPAKPGVDAQGIGQLQVECELPDVVIQIDGKQAGSAPLSVPLLVSSGSHQVLLSRPGYRVSEHTVNVAAGASATVRCEMAEVSPVPPAAASRLQISAMVAS